MGKARGSIGKGIGKHGKATYGKYRNEQREKVLKLAGRDFGELGGLFSNFGGARNANKASRADFGHRVRG